MLIETRADTQTRPYPAPAFPSVFRVFRGLISWRFMGERPVAPESEFNYARNNGRVCTPPPPLVFPVT